MKPVKGLREIFRQHRFLTTLTALGAISQLLTSTHVLPDPSRKDTLVHFSFSIMVSQMVFLVIRRFGQLENNEGKTADFTTFGKVFLVLLSGTVVGVLWEITEFTLDHTIHAGLQHGNVDTMTDLIADMLGSLVGGLFTAFGPRLWHRLGKHL